MFQHRLCGSEGSRGANQGGMSNQPTPWHVSAAIKINDGVACFCAGNVDAAFNYLHQSFQEYQKAIFPGSSITMCYDVPGLCSHFPCVGRFSILNQCLTEESGILYFEDEDFPDQTFIFFRATPQQNWEQCATWAIYNLATLHYWRGCHGTGYTSDLESAFDLYRHAYQMQCTLEEMAHISLTPTLVLAASNALCEISYFCGDTPNAELMSDHLLKSILLLSQMFRDPLATCPRSLRERLLDRAYEIYHTPFAAAAA